MLHTLTLCVLALNSRTAAIENTCNDDDAPCSLPAPPSGPIRFIPLDATCGISVAKGFLSNAEANYMLKFVKRTGGWQASTTGGKTFKVTKRKDSGGMFEDAARTDPVVARIEARIANFTGIPVHPHEDIMSLARITTRGNSPRGGHFPPFGLHHETDTRPHRARTILVYLRTVGEGGRTVFPLCGAHGASKETVPEVRAMKALRLEKFTKALMGQWGERDTWYQRHTAFDVTSTHPFNDLLTDVCRGDDGVAMAAKKGWALMFDSMSPASVPHSLEVNSNSVAREGELALRFAKRGSWTSQYIGRRYDYARRNWHAGCNVLNGTKVILQKFKELPMALRNDRSTGPPNHPYNPYVFE